MSAEDSLRHAEELMERLPDAAIEVLSELAQIAKDVEAALSQAKREADAQA